MVPATEQSGDPGGHRSTSSCVINVNDAPVVSGNYDPHGDREDEDDETARAVLLNHIMVSYTCFLQKTSDNV